VVEQAELAEEMRERTLSLREEGVAAAPSSPPPSVSLAAVSGLEELELPDTVLAMESFFLQARHHTTRKN
jgi:hypothetical protein